MKDIIYLDFVLDYEYSFIEFDKVEIHVCNYRIVENDIPFLLYELEQQNNVLCFPTLNVQTAHEFKKYIHSLSSSNIIYKGYILRNGHLFMFLQTVNMEYKIKIKEKGEKNWWCLIDEICNSKRVINIPVSKQVTNTFLKNPFLIYLKNDGERCEIPSVYFFGDNIYKINCIRKLGLYKTSGIFCNGYYGYSFKDSMKRAIWSENYRVCKINKTVVSDECSKNKQGGILRFCVFGEKNHHVLYSDTDEYYPLISFLDNEQKKDTIQLLHDKLTVGKIKYKNIHGYFNTDILCFSETNNINILSSHLVNMCKAPYFWHIGFNKYDIL